VTAAPAQIPARRLNRYEYNCTVRDLLGADFHLGEDFPADNFSYGFDNNAATLTATPALLAKYLETAKKIARAAIEPVPPPASPQLERWPNNSASAGITWRRTFIWDGDYDLHIAIAGRADPFALYLSLDGGEPEQLPVSADFEARRYSETRLTLPAGVHQLRVFAVRDDDRTVDQVFAYQQSRAGKTAPLSKPQIRTRLLAGELPDFKGALAAPYPEYLETRGPFGLVLPAIPPSYYLVFTCGHAPGHHSTACLRTNLTTLAQRAWRRPVTAAELDRLLQLVSTVPQSQQMEAGLQAILLSPSFLFRFETPASNFTLASRLSYFLWSSLPDQQLFQAAQRRHLSDPTILSAQAKRMLADPKSKALAENFAAQWLEFRNLDFIHRDPQRFPQFDAGLRDAMRTETQLFVQHVFQEDRSVLDFLTAKYTFVNELLARHYGIPGVVGDRFRQVDLSATPRVGILTQASVLTVTSYSTRTSPVLRGKWILENILNDPPPPPPANVPALRDPATEPALTLRRQLEQHRANPACAGCHVRMDPLGFGLENFDAVGRWRSHDEALPVDSTGTLPDGSSFSGPEQLASILASHPDAFAQCLTEKLLIFALGRELNSEDRAAAAQIVQAAAKTNYRFSDLILGIVSSRAFRAVGDTP